MLLLLAGTLPTVRAQDTGTVTSLYDFTGGSDGSRPGGLMRGSDGNFYGTTYSLVGGPKAGPYGTVFRLTPAGGLTTLYTFTGGGDGGRPNGLIQGSDGNFYGTTTQGGDLNDGTIFQITPAGEFTRLYSFSDTDGYAPGSLLQGNDGDFYGTAGGGADHAGTVFRLTPAGALSTLHTFTGGDDGGQPGSLTQGNDGNFYGTTTDGGGPGMIGGTVFRLSAAGDLTTLHSLGGDDGFGPGGLVQGSDGNFYGVTQVSDGDYRGTVFRVTPAGGFTTLHRFTGVDGDSPTPSLVQGSDGNFYGTTLSGGPTYQPNGQEGSGVLYRITPAGQLSILYAFDNDEYAGWPSCLIQGNDGNFYGATLFDESLANGTIFELTINPPPVFFAGAVALSNGVNYLAFPNGNPFGYYSYLSDAHYIYHQDLGYEYVSDAGDGQGGVYLYDFGSGGFFYTGPNYPFPYLYDFNSSSVLYYYPDPDHAGRYNTGGVRYFYSFGTGQIISK